MIVDLLCPSKAGHFSSYLDVIIRELPQLIPGVSIRVPPDIVAPGTTETLSIDSFVGGGKSDADVVLMMEVNTKLVQLLKRRTHRGLLIGQDFRSPQSFFTLTSRAGLSRDARLRAVAGLAIREMVVRRHPQLHFAVVSPLPLAVGSSRLRAATRFTRDLGRSDNLTPLGSAGASNVMERRRLTIFGVIRRSKGLDLLVDALSLAQADVPQDTLVTIAGPTADNYEATRHALVQRLLDRGYAVDNRPYALDQAEVDSLLDESILVLPYVSDYGFSAVLGTAFERSIPTITSDFGWFGEVAKRAGLWTFENASATSLARTLARLPEGVPPSPAPETYSLGYASPREFVASLFGPLIEGSAR